MVRVAAKPKIAGRSNNLRREKSIFFYFISSLIQSQVPRKSHKEQLGSSLEIETPRRSSKNDRIFLGDKLTIFHQRGYTMIVQILNALQIEKTSNSLTSFAGLPLILGLAERLKLPQELNAIKGVKSSTAIAYRITCYL